MLKNWGLDELAKHEYEESIDEMKHADMLAERILFLDGLPNFQALGKLKIGENPKEVLECDLALELYAIPPLRAAIVHCEQVGDFVSRRLFTDIQIGRAHVCTPVTNAHLVCLLLLEQQQSNNDTHFHIYNETIHKY